MSTQNFRGAGHPPTLIASFLYFDVSFMVWVILGALGPFLGEAYHLDPAQKGFLTAVPLLGGSFFRPVLGWSTKRFGGRATGLGGLGLTMIPLLLGWLVAGSYHDFLTVGLLLGVAGASFAAALPLAGSWYPPQHQGLAMGIAGAGNSGSLLATLFAPRFAQSIGWKNVLGLAIVPVAIVWIAFFLLAKDAPGERKVKRWADYADVLNMPDTWWFCFLYSLTFGGFVGLSTYLSIFFHDQYGLTKVQSGDFTTFVILFGSCLRPVGGALADKVGGYRLLIVLLGGAGICMAGVAALPAAIVALGLLALGMGMLGMGNGSVFQLLPQRFTGTVALMTGIVGAAGGLGGFLLPSILGVIKGRTGSFGIGFAVLAALAFSGVCALVYLRPVWSLSWPADAAIRAGIRSDSEAASRRYAPDR